MNFVKQPLLLLIACSVLQLTACSPTYKATVASHKEAKICCKSMSDFDYESIDIGQSKELKIDENSPAFVFDSGKSSFKAFRLPVSTQPYHVKIQSYPIDTISGSYEYIFHPVLLTLDGNYNIVQNIDTQRIQPITKFDSILTGVKFEFKGQVPITPESKEKYVVVLTTAELIRNKTTFKKHRPYCLYCKQWTIKHAPHGKMTVSLVRPKDLNKDDQESWKNTYEAVRVNERYVGHGFTILPPRAQDYRFKDLFDPSSKNVHSSLKFAKLMEGESAVAFVNSISLTSIDIHKDPEEKFAKLVSLLKKYAKDSLYNETYDVSKISIGGADCRRIDFYGNSKYGFSLPMRGYDIACLHPSQPELVIRIGTGYVYPLGESTTLLPKELSDFYRGLQFISLESE